MNDLAQASFDYDTLPTAAAVALQMAADRIRLRMKRTAEDIVAIGQDLIAAKERLPHGQFGAWLQVEFQMSASAATKFMQVAERFGSKIVNFTDLPASVIYQLAAPSTPESIVEQVATGEVPATTVAVKEVIRAAKAAEARAQADAEKARQEAQAMQERLIAVQADDERRQHEYAAARQNVAALQEAVEELEAELTRMQRPEKQIVEKVVTDPQQAQRIEELQSQIARLSQEKQQAVNHALELQRQAQAEAQNRFEGEQERRTRLAWFTARGEMLTAARKVISLIPARTTLDIFEAQDWQTIDEVTDVLQRALTDLRSLQRGGTVVDAWEVA